VWSGSACAPGIYRATDAAIRAAPRRWRRLQVADWNGASAGRPWFSGDGLHLNTAGALGLAKPLRQQVQACLAAPRPSGP